jgi:hypothetical protein
MAKKSHNRKTKRTVKQKGGVSFNAPVCFGKLGGNYYPYNNQQNSPLNPSAITDARLANCSNAEGAPMFFGGKGKKRRTQKKRSKVTKKKRSKAGRRKRGGLGCIPLDFGTISGNKTIKNVINGQKIPSNKLSSDSPFLTIA